MSVQALAWVLECSEARLGGRLVLLSIANHADERGDNAWPSVPTIAREARMSERQVRTVLRDLVELGELEINEGAGPRGCHMYRLTGIAQRRLWDGQDPGKIRRGEKSAGVKNRAAPLKNPTPTPEKSDRKPLKNFHPNHPLPIQEPSRPGESARQRAARATRIPEDFELTPERRIVAEAETLPADRTFAQFVDHWRSASGSKARKVDWDATWRNWCRREADMRQSRQPGKSSYTDQLSRSLNTLRDRGLADG